MYKLTLCVCILSKRWVKCSLVQALRLCTGRTAHRGSRSIALLFLDHGTRKGVRGQRHVPAALYPREGPVTHCTGRCVGPRAGLDRCGKSGPDRDSIRGPSSPWPVAIPTELPGPWYNLQARMKLNNDTKSFFYSCSSIIILQHKTF